jgi:hypothetical protein
VGCAAPPAHELPTVHTAHVPVVAPQPPADALLVEAYPGEQVHAAGWALSPAQL